MNITFCSLVKKDWTSVRGFENTRSTTYSTGGTPSCCCLCYWLLDFEVLFRRVHFSHNFDRMWNASKLLSFSYTIVYVAVCFVRDIFLNEGLCVFVKPQSSALGFLLAQKHFTNPLVAVPSAVSVVCMAVSFHNH